MAVDLDDGGVDHSVFHFVLLAGQRFDTVGVAPLIDGVEFDALIADKAFDSDAIIAELNERGAKSSSPNIHAAQSRSPSTGRCTNGVT